MVAGRKIEGQGEDREESTEVDQANEAGRGGKSSRVRNGERKVIQKKERTVWDRRDSIISRLAADNA